MTVTRPGAAPHRTPSCGGVWPGLLQTTGTPRQLGPRAAPPPALFLSTFVELAHPTPYGPHGARARGLTHGSVPPSELAGTRVRCSSAESRYPMRPSPEFQGR